MIIRITYPQPGIWLDLWGGTSGSFAGLDQFNRIIDQRWQNNTTTTPTDIDRYQYGYDQNSNRTYKANVVGTPIVTGGLDEFYAYDPLNRLTDMQRGVLNSTNTGITGTPTVEQGWTLDSTGNWSGFLTKASGTTNLNQTRTSNPVNEITKISESTGPSWVAPAYDVAGNTATMPQVSEPTQSFTPVYDAWNRMVSISDISGTVATYAYDGRNRRIVKLTYAGGSLSETRHFYFTNAWQEVEERIGTSTAMDEQYVWGVRYVDELVCRDDATPQRFYACQDGNFHVTSIASTIGAVQERYQFDPYGVRRIMNSSWIVRTSSAYGWDIGHQGLMHDPESGLVNNRNRMLHPMLGTFAQRDSTEYISGVNLYQYEAGNLQLMLDPSGFFACPDNTCDTWIFAVKGEIVAAAVGAGVFLEATLEADRNRCCMARYVKNYDFIGVGLGAGLKKRLPAISGQRGLRVFTTPCENWAAHNGWGRLTGIAAGFWWMAGVLYLDMPGAYLTIGPFSKGFGAGLVSSIGRWHVH